jgi:adenosylmethionine-8-amino-7-oxononanoate aminotransferase
MKALTKKLIEADKQYVWHPFTQMADWLAAEPVIIEGGEGFFLIDTEGKKYIDGVSSLWCNVHGHKVKKIDDAIRAQLEKVDHSTLLGLGQTKSIELAEKLIQITPSNLQKVFYSDSGATSVEIAIKMAYQFWHNTGQKKRTKFIALENSYHGDTIGSVSVESDCFTGYLSRCSLRLFLSPARIHTDLTVQLKPARKIVWTESRTC